MERFRKFAVSHPIWFGVVMILAFALVSALAWPAHYLFPENEAGQLYGEGLADLLTALVFIALLWRWGWLKAAGLTRLGDRTTWLIVAALLIYKIPAELYAFTGSVSGVQTNTPVGVAQFVITLPGSLVEEVMVRGLILVAMLLAWGQTKRGQAAAIIGSSVIFGLTHLFNLMIRPPGVVLFQTVIVMLPGILYAALLLARRSLWPAILIHWLSNAAVNVRAAGIENYQETFTMWVLFGLALLPVMAFSAYLIWKLPEAYQFEGEGAAAGAAQLRTARA